MPTPWSTPQTQQRKIYSGSRWSISRKNQRWCQFLRKRKQTRLLGEENIYVDTSLLFIQSFNLISLFTIRLKGPLGVKTPYSWLSSKPKSVWSWATLTRGITKSANHYLITCPVRSWEGFLFFSCGFSRKWGELSCFLFLPIFRGITERHFSLSFVSFSSETVCDMVAPAILLKEMTPLCLWTGTFF